MTAPPNARWDAAEQLAALPRLDREIAMMERAIAAFDRHRKLTEEMEARGLTLLDAARTMAEVAEVIAVKHGLSLEDLIGRATRHSVAWPRQEAMYELSQRRLSSGRRRWSTPQIGQFLGGRDHSTVVWGIRAHLRRAAEAAR
jgi:chromosomal replication initiation ATPase DnaA